MMVLDVTWYELFLKTNTGDNWKFDWEARLKRRDWIDLIFRISMDLSFVHNVCGNDKLVLLGICTCFAIFSRVLITLRDQFRSLELYVWI